MRIDEIEPGSPQLEAAIDLWRQQSATLGFLPRGAFIEGALRGQLIGAFDADSALAGYLLFRTSESFGAPTASLIHLCVRPSSRGTGLARKLFLAMQRRTKDCLEIRLRCRRDFAASAMWPKLGFVARGEVRARAAGGTLTIWSFSQGTPPLLSMMLRAPADEAGIARCVLDASVFFELASDDDPASSETESHGLLADWLGEYVKLFVTDELLNRIHEHPDARLRGRQRDRAGAFPTLPVTAGEVEVALTEIGASVGDHIREVRSRARLLAAAVAGDADVFVTRDGDLLRAADHIELTFGLLVLAPHELVVRSDTIRRSADYQPRRLAAGAATRLARATADDLEDLVGLQHQGEIVDELRRVTRARLRSLLSQPDAHDVRIVRDAGIALASFVLTRPAPTRLDVSFFAVAPTKLGRTAARHFAEHLVGIAAGEGRAVVHVEDPGPRTLDALRDVGFVREGASWTKIAIAAITSAAELAIAVGELGRAEPAAKHLAPLIVASLEQVSRATASSRPTQADDARIHELERALWPAKLQGVDIPCFLIPIQPDWAKDLFDTELAVGTLFGGRSDLIFNGENVYYRAAAPPWLVAPARVLWYVSKGRGNHVGTMTIRACSRVDQVLTRPASELYAQFRRLGVFAWKDVLKAAKGKADAPVMGVRFSGTERFERPVPRAEMEEVVFRNDGKKAQLVTAMEISERSFFELYRRGTTGDA